MKKITLLFAVLCAGVLNGMEPIVERYTPKIYIKNQNTAAYKSPGILCKINDKHLVFVPMNTEKVIDPSAYENGIQELVLQPSTAGTIRTGWFIGMVEYDVTKRLWVMLANQKEGSQQDIEIVVDNKSLSGAWNIQMRWLGQGNQKLISMEKKPLEEKPQQLLKRLQREYEIPTVGPKDIEGNSLSDTMDRYYKEVVSADVSKLAEEYKYFQGLIHNDLRKYIEKNSSVVGIQKDILMEAFKQLNADTNELAFQILGIKNSLLVQTSEKIVKYYIHKLNVIQQSISKNRVQLASIHYNLAQKTNAQLLLLAALDQLRLITVNLLVLLMDELHQRYEGTESEGGTMYYTPESSEEDMS